MASFNVLAKLLKKAVAIHIKRILQGQAYACHQENAPKSAQ